MKLLLRLSSQGSIKHILQLKYLIYFILFIQIWQQNFNLSHNVAEIS